MGGNGQFNRLQRARRDRRHLGPWRDRLTEDQDLGLRLDRRRLAVSSGAARRSSSSRVFRLRPLLRQRTRWAQGNLQALGLTGDVRHAPLRVARVDLVAHLLMPVWQGFIGLVALLRSGSPLTGTAPFWAGGP